MRLPRPTNKQLLAAEAQVGDPRYADTASLLEYEEWLVLAGIAKPPNFTETAALIFLAELMGMDLFPARKIPS